MDWFERICRRLLALYPRAFRDRFAAEMLELLATRREKAAGRGRVAWLFFPVHAFVELVTSAWRERRRDHAVRPHAGRIARLVDDLGAALRRVRRSPTLTLTVVGLMALAIGSATVVFSVVNTVLLRPLPYADPDRIAILWETRANTDRNVVGGHEFPVWARQNRTFDAMAAMIFMPGVHLTEAGEPASLFGMRVSASFFKVMGTAPAIGRGFTGEEDTEGNGAVVVLSDRLWRERFGGDRRVIGTEIWLNNRAFTVIGVMPPGFAFPPATDRIVPDLWSPIAEPIERYQGRHYLAVIGRLKPSVTMAQAQADLSAVAATLTKDLPELNFGHGVRVSPLQADLVRNARASLLLLLGAVGCLLLIGCSNVAGLLLARGVIRRREVSLVLALGATRPRVARQLLVESLVLSIAGGALGVAIALFVTGLVPALVPLDILRLDPVQVDRTVLFFAVGVSVVTGLLFGCAPAIQIRHFGLADTLRRGGRSLRGGEHARVRRALVSAQVALAVLLVLGAGLMMRGLIAVQGIDPGFNTDRTLTVDVSLRGPRYGQPAAQREFFETFAERLAAIPGVVSVGATDSIPLSGNGSGTSITIEGRPVSGPADEATALYRVVSTGFFRTMGVPIVAGRAFESSDARLALPLIRWFDRQPFPPLFDRPQAAPVVVINQSMAKAYWPGQTPIGRRFRMLESPLLTIVGVAADSHTVSLRDATGPEFYLCDLQEPQSDMGILIRTSGQPTGLVASVRAALQEVDPKLPLTSLRTMAEYRDTAFDQPRFMSMLFGAFGLMALVLMSAGIYGLLSFTTAQRLPEMGVRVALGAPRARIHRLVLRDALAMTILGVAAGLAAAVALGRVLTDQFFGIAPTDAPTYTVVTLLVLAVVTVACWLPARRAARVDPIVVLKQE
jgi:putative ABC transport system permease protein